MRPPPAVAVDCRTGLGWRLAQAALCGLAAAALAAWGAGHAELKVSTASVLAGGAFALATAVAFASIRGASGRLEWTGSRWQWAPVAPVAAAAGEGGAQHQTPAQTQTQPQPQPQPLDTPPDLMIDLEAWMLLRGRLPRPGTQAGAPWPRTLWMPVSRADNAAVWGAWRAAVYSPASRPGTRSQPERPLS